MKGWTFEYPAPAFDNTELGLLRQELYETYRVDFMTEFDKNFYEFDWNDEFDMFETEKVPASDYAYTVQYLNEVKAVLQQLPASVTQNLPSHVILVDSLKNPYRITYQSKVLSEPMHGVMGYKTTNFIVFSYAGQSFPLQDINELRETWAELFFEHTLRNEEAPAAFKEIVTNQAKGSLTGYRLTSSWKSTQAMTTYGFLEDSYVRRKEIMYGNANYRGVTTALYYNGTMTEVQDLALFMAFTMYRPQAGKEAMYAKSSVFAQKEEVVKSFCSETLGFELKPVATE